MTITMEYSSNNSGGGWWLSDDDWKNLETAGWVVKWEKDNEDSLFGDGERFLGALATRAEFTCDTPEEAFDSFTSVTGQNLSDIGCDCCGPPHSFSWKDEKGEWHYATAEHGPSYFSY